MIKTPVDGRDGFVRERAALSFIRDHRLPAAVRLLGATSDPPLLVLEDLGDGPSVADRLLGDDPIAAGDAVNDWAAAVGSLQAASAGLGAEFESRLRQSASAAGLGSSDGDPLTRLNWLEDWRSEVADALASVLQPFGVGPVAAAAGELRSLRGRTPAGGRERNHGVLVPGDTCPDNALYVGGRLTLIDFEAAAYRDPAWEAAYLVVPWPTCWCSWALPAEVSARALSTWRATVAPAVPEVASTRLTMRLRRQ